MGDSQVVEGELHTRGRRSSAGPLRKHGNQGVGRTGLCLKPSCRPPWIPSRRRLHPMTPCLEQVSLSESLGQESREAKASFWVFCFLIINSKPKSPKTQFWGGNLWFLQDPWRGTYVGEQPKGKSYSFAVPSVHQNEGVSQVTSSSFLANACGEKGYKLNS